MIVEGILPAKKIDENKEAIAVLDIKILKSKDIIELKRAIAKVKKTVDAIEGSIAGFGENIIIVTPKFAQIQKAPAPKKEKTDFISS